MNTGAGHLVLSRGLTPSTLALVQTSRLSSASIVLTVATAVAAAGAAASVTAGRNYVPTPERQQIVAYFGSTYLPSWLPPGYVFSRWDPSPGSVDAYGEYLDVTFGKHGALLRWTVDDPQDPQTYSHDACSQHPFGSIHLVDGRRIVYSGGAVGQTAILCLARTRAVTVWDGYSVKAPVLEKIAARAALVS